MAVPAVIAAAIEELECIAEAYEIASSEIVNEAKSIANEIWPGFEKINDCTQQMSAENIAREAWENNTEIKQNSYRYVITRKKYKKCLTNVIFGCIIKIL